MNKIFIVSSRKKIPIFSALFDYRNLIVFYPWIMRLLSRKIRKFKPERVVISSFAIGKNISPFHKGDKGDFSERNKTPPLTKGGGMKLYLHSPMQYIWSHREEYLAKFTGRKKRLFSFLVPRLQQWDKQFTQFDEIFFNSQYTQALAKGIYGMEGNVSYPKIKDTFYYAGVNLHPQEYFVCVGRLVVFVRESDLIIKAFNQLKLPLLMIGAGPDEEYLKAIAGDNILFLGRLSPEETQKIVRNAKALVNLTKESFGMGTAEALLMGVPVIGYADGATPELVDEESGILLEKKTMKHLVSAVEEFQEKKWERKKISERIREKLQ
ncbi:MAG: glycosyltransferase [Candidatus Peribacteria bacterium]|nr:glycosyltransferase [Candidatus Peribacteria bacterium]